MQLITNNDLMENEKTVDGKTIELVYPKRVFFEVSSFNHQFLNRFETWSNFAQC
jgi:hypothetical protein